MLLLDDDGDDDHLMGGIGNREYGFPQRKPFLDDVDDAAETGIGHDEDDILGDLSKPVGLSSPTRYFFFLVIRK